MPRLTRLESQALTLEQLIDSATALFIRDGYRTTSLAAVAQHAGYSTGAVYSNFASKSDLGLAVLDRLRAAALSQLSEAFTVGDSLDARLDALTTWTERELGESAWPRLELEFALDARSDPDRVEQIARRQRAARDALAGLLDGLGLPGVHPALPSPDLARVLISLAIGHSMQRLIDPHVSPRSMTAAVRALLDPATPGGSR